MIRASSASTTLASLGRKSTRRLGGVDPGRLRRCFSSRATRGRSRRSRRRSPRSPSSPSGRPGRRAGPGPRARHLGQQGDQRPVGRVVERRRPVLGPAPGQAGDHGVGHAAVGRGQADEDVGRRPGGIPRARCSATRPAMVATSARRLGEPAGGQALQERPRRGGGGGGGRVGEPAVAVDLPVASAAATGLGGLGRRRGRRPGRAGRPGGPGGRRRRAGRRRGSPRRPWARPGRTCTAFRRTPAEAWPSAATAASVAAGSDPSSAPRPCRVQRAWIAAGAEADRVDLVADLIAAIRAGTTSFLPRSTRSRWAWSRQSRLSLPRAATSPAASCGSSLVEVAATAVPVGRTR